MKTNVKARSEDVRTHEGAKAFPHLKPIDQLRRSVLSCLLWEREFYEDGVDIAKRILDTASQCPFDVVADLAVEARSTFNLRHAPLMLLIDLVRRGGSDRIGDTIAKTIQRADELTELVALYWKMNPREGRKQAPLSKQLKRGLAMAFAKLDAYQLAKYDRDSAVKLRDVMFLAHPKAGGGERDQLYAKLAERTLESPDTWEVALSTGKAPKETWERLLADRKLGYMALIRNLRNMEKVGVDSAMIEQAILARRGGAERVLPFRFISAAKAAPRYEEALDKAMLATLAEGPKLAGKTIVIIDISGSMGAPLSDRSDVTRMHVACALGAIAREVCENPAIYATSGNDWKREHKTALVPARRGMALVDAIASMTRTLGGGGIFLKPVMDFILGIEKSADRIIVITDEQDCAIDSKDSPLLATPFGKHNYLINVASAKNGIGYGKWTHIDGFSDAVIRFIMETERRQ